MIVLPTIRQVVVLVPQLNTAVEQFRDAFGFTEGVRDEVEMAKLGFEHEIFTFGTTFLEICSPLSRDSHAGQLVDRVGSSGYMLDVQVDRLDGVVERASAQEVRPVLHERFRGHAISQWHPRDFGTLAEFDQVDPTDSWHFAPQIFEHRCTAVVQDIAGATIASARPDDVAARWAHVLGEPLASPRRLPLGSTALAFARSEEQTGLVAVEVTATDRRRAGRVVRLSGVDFHLI